MFFSQSGDYQGAGGPPLTLAASREGGTPALIAALRKLGLDLAGVRLMWLIIVLFLGVFAFRRLGRHFEAGAGEIGLMTFGLFWTTLIFSTGLYGSLIWACLAVLFLAAYLEVLDSPETWGIVNAVGFGLLVAAMFWMRSLESVFVVGLLGLHSLFWRKAFAWRRAPRSMLVAAGVFGATYLLPWAVWSTMRWGSVAARLDAVAGAVSRAEGTELNGLRVYWDGLVGGIPANGLFAIKPTWVWPFIAAFLALSMLIIVWALLVARGSMRTNLVVVVAPFALLVLYFSVIYVDAFRDRYLSGLVPVFAAALGASVSVVWRSVATSRLRLVAMGVGVALFGVWGIAQLAIADDYRYAQIEHALVTERTIDTVRALSGEESCVGVARYGRAQVAYGSGCRVVSASTIDGALKQLAANEDRGVIKFLIWPNRDLEAVPGIDPGWVAIDFSTKWRSSILYVLDSDCPDPDVDFYRWGTVSELDCATSKS